MNDPVWQSTIPASLFQHGPQLTPLFRDLMANDSANLHASVPILMLQGARDTMVTPQMSRGVSISLCANHATLDYRLYPGSTHDSVLVQAQDDAQAWAADRFANRTAPSTCGAM
jgi:predicted esterase